MESSWRAPHALRIADPAAFRELEEDTGMKSAEMLLIARFETFSVEHFVFVADFEKDYLAPMPLREIKACQWFSDDAKGLRLTRDSELILRTFRRDIRSI